MTFLKKLRSICAGWQNVRKKPELMRKEATKRTIICECCPLARKSWWSFWRLTCTKCGCHIAVKVWSPYESCPIGNWKEINPNELINDNT